MPPRSPPLQSRPTASLTVSFGHHSLVNTLIRHLRADDPGPRSLPDGFNHQETKPEQYHTMLRYRYRGDLPSMSQIELVPQLSQKCIISSANM